MVAKGAREEVGWTASLGLVDVFAFIFVCILHTLQSMFEGYQKKPGKQNNLKVEAGKAVVWPPKEMDPGHIRRIYLERSGELLPLRGKERSPGVSAHIFKPNI